MSVKSRFSLDQIWFVPVILLLAGLLALTWINFRFSETNPGGNDFLVHWVGTRALLVDGISPYSEEVAQRIQTQAYGRPAQPGEHELRVAYPLYSGILFTPFALISDYTLARALWMTFLEIGLFALAFLSLRLTNWKPGWFLLATYLLFSLLWYHGMRPLINGNAVILVAVVITGSLLAVKHDRDELAGILLGIATIKPNLVILVILFMWVWAVSHHRWRLILWTIVTVGLLSVFGVLFVPDWPVQNIREILQYPLYNPPGTPGTAFETWWPAAGRKVGWILSAFLILILLYEWLAGRKKEFRWFLWTACLTMIISQWIGLQTDPGNFVLLFPALTLVFAVWQERWGPRAQWTILVMILLVFFGLWWLFIRTVEYDYQPQQHPIMFFLLPAYLMVMIYWVRWWAIRTARLLIEELRISEEL